MMDDLKFAEQRTGEIGVRRALSAQTADVLRLIVNHNPFVRGDDVHPRTCKRCGVFGTSPPLTVVKPIQALKTE